MPTIRDTATVHPIKPVKGTRRSRGADHRKRTVTRQLVVNPEVLAAAKAARRPGKRIRIVSATEVRLEP